MKVQSIYTSKILKKGLEFAAKNGSLFTATAALAFSTARPLMILATPNTDRENREYAFTKSVSSTLIGYGLMFCASTPVAKAVKRVIEEPLKYLNSNTIRNLEINPKTPRTSPKFHFATQLFILGVGLVLAIPKSMLTCSLIPQIMKRTFKNKPENENNEQSKDITFKGLPFKTDIMSKTIGKIINKKGTQELANKLYNTNFEFLMISSTDILATAAFMQQTKTSKGIKEDKKKALIYNAAISTGLSIVGGYIINKLTENHTDKFITKFKEANKNSPKLSTYLEGIRIAKPALILGTLYYIVIPVISTFLADKFDNKKITPQTNKNNISIKAS